MIESDTTFNYLDESKLRSRRLLRATIDLYKLEADKLNAVMLPEYNNDSRQCIIEHLGHNDKLSKVYCVLVNLEEEHKKLTGRYYSDST